MTKENLTLWQDRIDSCDTLIDYLVENTPDAANILDALRHLRNVFEDALMGDE